jgi:hypothetical protein
LLFQRTTYAPQLDQSEGPSCVVHVHTKLRSTLGQQRDAGTPILAVRAIGGISAKHGVQLLPEERVWFGVATARTLVQQVQALLVDIRGPLAFVAGINVSVLQAGELSQIAATGKRGRFPKPNAALASLAHAAVNAEVGSA